MLELEATHTHLYPGARGRILSGAPGDGAAVIAFVDGGRAGAWVVGEVMRVEGYRTAAGTEIGAKAWRVAFGEGSFRVLGRASG